MIHSGIRTAAICALFVTALSASEVKALIVTSGCTGGDFGNQCSLAELTAGGSFRINDKVFDSWSLSALGIGLPNPPTTNRQVIRVDQIDSLFNPGFTLVDTANTWRFVNDGTKPIDGTGAAQLLDVLVFRVATIDGVARIKDNTLEVTIGEMLENVPDGSTHAQVVEDLRNLPLQKEAVCGLDPNPDPSACKNSTLMDHKDFAPVAFLDITKTISLRADSRGDLAEVDSITQRFSQVPEPTTLLLVVTALAGLGTMRSCQIRTSRPSRSPR